MKTSLLIVDDHTIVRQGLSALVASAPEFELAGTCGTTHEALAFLKGRRVDLVLVDLSLPDIPGIELIRMLKSADNPPRVLVLSMHSQPTFVRAALKAGADGYLYKGSDLGELLTAIREAAAGRMFLGRSIAEPVELVGELSTREEEVLGLVAMGKTSQEVGIILGISPKTVENHRARIMDKLGIHDLAGLTRYAVKIGLVTAD
jgi:DNA-binding NarL/FixJ family response regulator